MQSEEILASNLPKHIAIIMDGNGRWAQSQNRPRFMGHKRGAKVVEKITNECGHLEIEQLTLYAFSTENWQRPENEVNYLMNLLKNFIVQERKNIMKNNIQFFAIGNLEKLSNSVYAELKKTTKLSKNNTGMKLCLALSYSARKEIVDTTKKIAQQVINGTISITDIDETLFQQNLYQPNMPAPDLLIRTGGDMRVSNFLLWQIAYSELWITSKMWPDFTCDDLHCAINDFSKRERRFGKTSSQIKHSEISI